MGIIEINIVIFNAFKILFESLIAREESTPRWKGVTKIMGIKSIVFGFAKFKAGIFLAGYFGVLHSSGEVGLRRERIVLNGPY